MKVAAVQFCAEPFRPFENQRRLSVRIEEAGDRGAELVVLPELAVSGYVLEKAKLDEVAEELNGPTLQSWTALASQRNVLIAGGFCEVSEGKLFNSAMLVGPQGLILHYRKLHLFDQERNIFAPGDLGLPVADTPLGRIGLCVCYDLRFVEVVRLLALQGAILTAVPTAWVGGFDQTPCDAEGFITQARGAVVQANLNQTYIACASQSGSVANQTFLGNSLVVDPYGKVLAGPLNAVAERTLVADFDARVALAAQHRSELVNPRTDRRTDVYGVHLHDRVL